MERLEFVNRLLAGLLFACYAYQIGFIFVALLGKCKRFVSFPGRHYAFLIAARNEETVLPHLIESIRRQDYPRQLVSIFVVADNCTDNTAEIARQAGAKVYVRQDKKLAGKGYALDFLLAAITWEYGANRFDGYLVFDADNVLEPDYLSEMDKTFSAGYEIVTSYRNSKNYADNWISAGYGLWFLREARTLNQARMQLGTGCAVSGTGFLFSRAVLEQMGGWPHHLLTEDIEFTVDQAIRGVKAGYCATAVFYDEQPVTFAQAWRQRLRWAKGFLQVFRRYGAGLVRETSRGSFTCFDLTCAIMPAFVISVSGILANLLAVLGTALAGGETGPAVLHVIRLALGAYLGLWALGALTTATEWRRIHASTRQKIFYTFTFPLFMFTYIPISLTALFRKVTWQPIRHSQALSLAEIRKGPG
ncbi:MAG: glycosyltransferase family 2 protein [Clostridiaceae bacterium]|jgi:cellulose synthase/poly-beta-1,6-N-acetylglucosamine synthase-like glycosyltransferase|nr:glycosyltransferase family 2 protein [Clostridiaceae bacterium]